MPFPYNFSTFNFGCEIKAGFINSNTEYFVGETYKIAVCGFAETDTVILLMTDYLGSVIRNQPMTYLNGVFYTELDFSLSPTEGDYIVEVNNQDGVKLFMSIELKPKALEGSMIEILGSMYLFKLGEFYKVFCRCDKGVPSLDLKSSNGTLIETLTAVTYNSTPSIFVFDLLVDDLGETSSTGAMWQDGYYALKAYSPDTTDIDIKPIKLVRPEDWYTTSSDSDNLAISLTKEAFIKM